MKLKKYCHLVLVILLVLSCQKAFAEYYRYVDESGQVRYTDNIDMIPVEQRPDVQEYYELQSIPEETKQGQDQPASEESTEQIEINPAVLDGDANEINAALESKKQAIDNEQKKLLEEKTALENSYKKIRSKAGMDEHKKKVTNLNTRIVDFEKRRQVFNAEAEAFNAKLKAGTK